MRRAVITGMGMITPIGTGKDAFWDGLQTGRSGIRRITTFDTGDFRSRIAGEVPDFDPTVFIEPKRLKRMDRFSQFAVVAAKLAVADAGLDFAGENRERAGVCLGSALGGIGFAEQQLYQFTQRGLRAVDTSLALSVFCGAGSCNIAMEFGLSGPATANSNSCASGTVAFGEAFEWIRKGQTDIMLAGGAEAPLFPLCYGAFALIRAMSCRNDEPMRACRPFDAERDGFVMAEGAAIMVVEEREHALARGAHIYAEILGYAMTNDAYHMAAPDPEGRQAARAISLALADAGVPPEAIDYLNAHGSSTPLNDQSETRAIKSVLGNRAYQVPISSTKGHHGHALGATGAIEAAACTLALEKQFIPPTLNLETPDPSCDLDYTPCIGRPHALNTVLSNSFGFGGINACLVLRKDA